jgi:hypothetical protein
MRRPKIYFEQVPVAAVIQKLANGTATLAPLSPRPANRAASISGTTTRSQGNAKRKAKKP